MFIVAITFTALSSSLFSQELSEAQEEEAKSIEGMLIAPCCWRSPVSVHYSPAADEIRSEVRKMLAEGLNQEEIINHFVAEYGEKILAKPPATGFNLLAYFLPALFLAVGAMIAVVVVKKLRPTLASEKKMHSGSTKLDSAYEERIEKELWD